MAATSSSKLERQHVSIESRQSTSSNVSDEKTPLVGGGAGDASDPQQQHYSSLAMTQQLARGSRNRRRACILVLYVIMTVMVGGMMSWYVVQHHKDAAIVADLRTTVSITEAGEYKVKYSRQLTPDDTFADLAALMIPGHFVAAQMAASSITIRSEPGAVRDARKCLLATRNLLDVFSPVYEDVDMRLFTELRRHVKDGYKLAGQFQDLDHAHVIYNKALWTTRRGALLRWKHEFAAFAQQHKVLSLVLHPNPTGCIRTPSSSSTMTKTSSHLFWTTGDGGDDNSIEIPCGDDLASPSLQKLAALQLENALRYLGGMSTYDETLSVDHVLVYHNFRKQIRSFLDEYALFGFVVLPHPTANDQHTLELFTTARDLLGAMHDHWVAYDLYHAKGVHEEEQRKLQEQIASEWKSIKRWTSENDLAETIKDLIESLRTS